MRTAYFDRQWIRGENEKIIGVNLGYDRCAEHEWGISGLKNLLGITPEFGLGIERHRVRNTPACLSFMARKITGKSRRSRRKYAVGTLVCADLRGGVHGWTPPVPDAIFRPESEDSAEFGPMSHCEWDSDGFAISVMGDENIAALKRIYEAVKDRNATLSLSGTLSSFSGNGLCVVVASEISADVAEKALRSDESHQRLLAAVQATGIEDELKKAGLKYFALSPRWLDEQESSFKFWLNPWEQHMHNYGWFTIDDLRQWIAGKGPIIKEPTKA